MDWLEANVLSKSQEQLSLQWPQKQRRSHVARGNPACQLALAEQRPAEGTEGRQDRRNPEHPPGAHSLAGELTVRCGPEGWSAWECGRISGEGELASSRSYPGRLPDLCWVLQVGRLWPRERTKCYYRADRREATLSVSFLLPHTSVTKFEASAGFELGPVPSSHCLPSLAHR